ncbi:MAG: hypothetical protein HC880_04890 [Bacteroidia bacterium]|nr:hypothetical protein [Bacteroidia bacterium]
MPAVSALWSGKGWEPAQPGNLRGDYLAAYLGDMRVALSEIFQRNYFITSRMGQALNSRVQGILPLVAVFMARTGNRIIRIQEVVIEPEGKATFAPIGSKASNARVQGVFVEFIHPSKTEPQQLYYFGTDLSNAGMQQKPELAAFIRQFPDKITLIKSASYLLHTAPFSQIRQLILEESEACLQDDTGVPYQYFQEGSWQVQLYGKYARPIRDFNHGYQPALAQRFAQDQGVKPIDFTFGYHWWTDNSSIILAQK